MCFLFPFFLNIYLAFFFTTLDRSSSRWYLKTRSCLKWTKDLWCCFWAPEEEEEEKNIFKDRRRVMVMDLFYNCLHWRHHQPPGGRVEKLSCKHKLALLWLSISKWRSSLSALWRVQSKSSEQTSARSSCLIENKHKFYVFHGHQQQLNLKKEEEELKGKVLTWF